MKITREAEGTRFENVEANNGLHNFYSIGVDEFGVLLMPEFKVRDGEYFIPHGYYLVVKEFLYCGEDRYFSHDEFQKEFKL